MPAAMHTAAASPAATPDRVERELAAFERHAGAPRMGRSRVERIEPHAFVLRPQGAAEPGIDLLLMALVHGNEVGGLLVLNAVCELLASGLVAPAVSVGMVACNVAAARRGVRHVERDLNRCFGRRGTGTAEDRRARELEPLMRSARHVVDLHQTIEPLHTPFFVFDYMPASLRFAHAIFPQLPVVTHAAPRGGDGCTGYEYVHREGGIVVGVELGQMGTDLYQVSLGTAVCLRAMALAAAAAADSEALPPLDAVTNPLYTWGDIVPYPAARVALRPGLANFQRVEAGEVLGEQAGSPVLAARSGWLLFPKYVHSELEPRPAELYRLMRRTHLDELKHLGRPPWNSNTPPN